MPPNNQLITSSYMPTIASPQSSQSVEDRFQDPPVLKSLRSHGKIFAHLPLCFRPPLNFSPHLKGCEGVWGTVDKGGKSIRVKYRCYFVVVLQIFSVWAQIKPKIQSPLRRSPYVISALWPPSKDPPESPSLVKSSFSKFPLASTDWFLFVCLFFLLGQRLL